MPATNRARAAVRLGLSAALTGLATAAVVAGLRPDAAAPEAAAAAKPTPKSPTPKSPAPDAKPAPAAGAADVLWWEAETPARTNFPERTWLHPANDKEREALSAGRWICFEGKQGGRAAFLEYDIDVPADGTWKFFARKCWLHGPFKWSITGASAASGEFTRQGDLIDSVDYRKFHPANWVSLGGVVLKKGRHTLRIELIEDGGPACFDAFVLTRRPFRPNGTRKPGEKYGRAPDGWFAFEPDPDTYAPSAIDLRGLNEKFAGEGGWIAARGDGFVHSRTGRPVRFWGVNGTAAKEELPEFARFLAKRGVNLVRRHGSVAKDDATLEPDDRKIDQVHAQVAALRKEGIYSLLSIYFPVWLNLKPEHGWEGYKGSNAFALLYFDAKLQDKWRAWWRALLTRVNPHTGVALKDDPAVAMIEIVNEDSLLFWTFNGNNVPAPQMAKLEAKFGEWLVRKYGGIDKAGEAWGAAASKGAFDGNRARFRPMWELFNNRDRRSKDTAEFLAVVQREFYETQTAWLRKECGYPGLIQASNWITADARTLGPLDKWSNAACDFMDRHGYFEARHHGENAGHSIAAGQKYQDRSALLFEGDKGPAERNWSLPLFDITYDGKPSIISEINWTPPNRFRADLPPLAAAYGLLQGTDGFLFFATGDSSWQGTLSKFAVMTPVHVGQYPTAALIYRRGLIKTGPAVVEAELRMADLFELKGAPVSQPQNLDEFRRKDVPPGGTVESADVSAVDPLAFLVGRVEFRFRKDAGRSRTTDLSKWIDRKAGIARSATGELEWNWTTGVVRINAPAVRGVAGFLSKAGAAVLGDVEFRSGLEYGALVLVAMDEQPIGRSRKMLLSVATEDDNFGWTADGSPGSVRTIKDVGGPPMVVRKAQGTVKLLRADAGRLKVTPLDANGHARGPAITGAAEITLAPDVLYWLIEG